MTRLDSDILIADARKSSGLDDFGDDTLADRVALVVDRLNAADLDAAGSQAAAHTINGLLTSRLRFMADHARSSLAAEQITAPLFAPTTTCSVTVCPSVNVPGRSTSAR